MLSEESVKFSVLTPIPEYVEGEVTSLASRPQSLDNLTLGLLPTWRPASAEVLNALGDLLQKKYRFKEVLIKQPIHGSRQSWDVFVASSVDEMVQRADAVITGPSD